MLGVYTLLIRFYAAVVRLAAHFKPKAKHWAEGRDHWRKALTVFSSQDHPFWFHCASVGEFEQARPVIEALKAEQPACKIVVTFFSPSGYQVRKDYALADAVTYLPTDIPANAEAFLKLLRPSAAIFVKYDFWFNFMQAIRDREIPFALISAYIPKRHWLLKWPGSMLVGRLNQFDRLFLQDNDSRKNLEQWGIKNLHVTGDTRIDRVLATKAAPFEHPALGSWIGQHDCLVIGSNWPADDQYLIPVLSRMGRDMKFLVAPHETNKTQEQQWKHAFDDRMVLWTEIRDAIPSSVQVVYVDTIGVLSKLYRFAAIAYVGGGFSAGIHNILEPAVYGIPVLFGPNNLRFLEAQQLKGIGIGLEVRDAATIQTQLKLLMESEHVRQSIGTKAAHYFDEQKGASEQVLQWLRSGQPVA